MFCVNCWSDDAQKLFLRPTPKPAKMPSSKSCRIFAFCLIASMLACLTSPAQEIVSRYDFQSQGQAYGSLSATDPEQLPADIHWFETSDTQCFVAGLARAYYVNDRRLQWTGQEKTFGVEGVLAGAMLRQIHDWSVALETELFVTQPYDGNILVDTPERVSYRGNFDYETLEISQLFIEANCGDFSLSIGKRHTPFGRYYFPLHTNRQFDAPFLRTEALNYRETGIIASYTPGIWDLTLAIVNGSEERDTNSMKAGIARVGIDGGWYAFGGSVKWHDGIGSESQKYRRNHVGIDAMVRRGRWSLSGEIVYDEYGFRRPFDPLDITWGRSIYNRDQFFAGGLLRGVGYYINLNYGGDVWTTVLNYGSFVPGQFTGDNIHDRTTHRGYAKFIRHFGQGLDGITTLMFENDVPNAQSGQTRRGFMFYTGVEYRF